ncbi:MBL fold metallo-hydrolase [Maridesulfovibrio salexigens]|uniref:Beta-lactamase domain protein n=1 Tax=Maridesulfovibrio salexigens (strain ATCC 14822 / DSM 2638 / NCIMB 8403 / VKM B-1763) TaxID=526222 RepID=C6BYW4_MARSD|nr:MBL fold metallo-hydrolase [Maridesulfovibrio salexigens]ACS80721.1 beta-lactamase domain protein [Maridesulfovibrio salexigens DSM 2638]
MEIEQYLVGSARITRIEETLITTMTLDHLIPEWGGQDGIEKIALEQRSLEGNISENIVLSVHSWLVELEGRVLLIDTGIGNGKIREFNAAFHNLNTSFLHRLKAVGIIPEQIDFVLLTHLHADHVGWNTVCRDGHWIPTFPNATYVFSEKELSFFSTPEGASRRVVFEDSVLPVIESGQAVLIKDEGGKPFEAFSFKATPGHSSGHMVISLHSDAQEAIFVGDTMHNPIQVIRPDWNSVFCYDSKLARKSRQQVLHYAAESGAVLFPSHFHGSCAGKVIRNKDGFIWQPIDPFQE